MTIKTIWSDILGEEVEIIKETHDRPQVTCTRCGKDLKTFYVVQSVETGVERMYLGAECIKHLM